LPERLALDELRHHVRNLVVVANVMHCDNSRMIQCTG
jgi:hypothetical protein